MARRPHSSLAKLALIIALTVIAGYTALFAFLIGVADTDQQWRVEEWTRLGVTAVVAVALSLGTWLVTGCIPWKLAMALCVVAGSSLFAVIALGLGGGPNFKPLDGVVVVASVTLLSVFATMFGLIDAQAQETRGHCANCGYDLKGLHADRCPECGNSI